ncbi:hypothetical protein LCGC14_3114450, partial [marine sediment metagenome]
MTPEDIKGHILTGFNPNVGVTEMKFFLLNEKGTPINKTNALPNKVITCPSGWRYRIEMTGMDCREVLIGNIRDILRSGITYSERQVICKIATHPPELAEGMPERFILYPTKAVPYLHMNSFETKAESFHNDPEVMAKWSDVFVGIISVLLDRNEATKRAFNRGYLEPKLFESIMERGAGYTFEYHSLSSYWCRCPELISLVMANMRVAARVSWIELASRSESALKLFWDRVSYDEVRDAIKKQDFDHALDIYNRIKDCMAWSSMKRSDPMNVSATNRFDYLEY